MIPTVLCVLYPYFKTYHSGNLFELDNRVGKLIIKKWWLNKSRGLTTVLHSSNCDQNINDQSIYHTYNVYFVRIILWFRFFFSLQLDTSTDKSIYVSMRVMYWYSSLQ